MSITRRQILQTAGAASLSVLVARMEGRTEPLLPQKSSTGLRIAYLTDSHLPGDKKQNQRMERALTLAGNEKPDMFLFGGDNVMAVDAGLAADGARTQFENWKDITTSILKAPSHSIIGNHDIWWISDKNKETAASAPGMDEKGWAKEIFGMPERYYAVDAGGWRLLMLDTFHTDGCHIDPEQFEWLKEQVASTTKPTLVSTHATILSVTHFEELGQPKEKVWKVPVGWQIGNAVETARLFRDNPHVKLAMSGHMHHVDRCDYWGTTYICAGAVSGSWWGGEYHSFGPAYVILDLEPSGEWSHRVVFWESEKA